MGWSCEQAFNALARLVNYLTVCAEHERDFCRSEGGAKMDRAHTTASEQAEQTVRSDEDLRGR